MKIFFCLLLACSLSAPLFAEDSSSSKSPVHWIQVEENEFVRFGNWRSLFQIEFTDDENAVGKIMEYSGGPRLTAVLAIKSRAAIERLKEKLTKEGNWFPATTPGGKKGFVRWNFVTQITVVPQEGNATARALKVTHITNRQPLELGLITEQDIVRDLLRTIEKEASR